EEPDAPARGASHERVRRLNRTDRLQVTVAARVEVGPADRWCLTVVWTAMRLVRIRVGRVKVLGGSYRTQFRDAGSEVLVVAAEEQAAAAAAEAGDVLDIARGERAPDVGAEEPQLVIGAADKLREIDVITCLILCAVARQYFVQRTS